MAFELEDVTSAAEGASEGAEDVLALTEEVEGVLEGDVSASEALAYAQGFLGEASPELLEDAQSLAESIEDGIATYNKVAGKVGGGGGKKKAKLSPEERAVKKAAKAEKKAQKKAAKEAKKLAKATAKYEKKQAKRSAKNEKRAAKGKPPLPPPVPPLALIKATQAAAADPGVRGQVTLDGSEPGRVGTGKVGEALGGLASSPAALGLGVLVLVILGLAVAGRGKG